ncbi:Hypothetical protein CINCED_3A023710 [Cinara cedri]|nr:Hypothetical protein CINCED_3A023710 [Cinara cedri]
MVFNKIELVFICLVAFYGVSYGDDCNNDLTSKSTAVKLSHELFCSYDKTVRPVINQSTQIIVHTSIFIYNIHLLEDWEVVQINFQLLMKWKDEFLVWDPSKYDNINFMHTNSKQIWIPDIMSYDSGYSVENSLSSYFLPESMVKVTNEGLIDYNQRVTLSAQCSANMAKWPFDFHNCSFFIGSPIYTNKYVNYTFTNNDDIYVDYSPNREWKIINVDHKCIFYNYDTKDNGSFSHCLIQYDVSIKRYSSMYLSSIIIPAVVISLMRTFTFLMGREYTLRIVLLCLFFISELLYIEFLDTKIPNNGENSVFIVLLYRNSLILTAVAIVICVVSNELYKHGTEDFPINPPEWIKSASAFLLSKRPITIFTHFNNQREELLNEQNMEEDTPNSQRDKNGLFWKTLSILLDRLFFLFTLLISIINFWYLIP